MSKLVTRGLSALAALAALAILALLPSPAQAATATFADAAGDIAPGADLRSVQVHNGAKNVWITLTARDLVRASSSGAGAAVFLDTDGQPGPEYVLGAGLFDGADYALSRTESWNLRKAQPQMSCSYAMRLDYAADTAKIWIGTGCFKAVPGDGTVRVEVRTSGTDADGTPATDWLGAARSFGPGIARG